MSTNSKVKVELVRGMAGTPRWMRLIVRTLGLKRRHQTKTHPDNAAIRGMVKRVPHLVRLEEVRE